ncbi:MAG: TIGR00730 family Rossman fold protein [Bacteroidetes bacterium]|nr:TIGR00730 family Rossman fold protein [Bacteroidota bacterium]
MKSICVFCGSSAGSNPVYAESARQLGMLLTVRKIKLIYGGASVGIMGVLADTMLEQGGEVIGVIPSFFSKKEIAHNGLTDLIFAESMHARKQIMTGLSDGFIALSGGFGTMDELFEVLTWAQLDLHQKPIGMLNINHYFDDLLRFFDHMVAEKFVKEPHRQMVLSAEEPGDLLDMMLDYRPVILEKWLNRIKA